MALTIPKAQIPVGLVTVAGQTLEVRQHPEFVRFFFDLFSRVGGTTSFTNADLADLVGDLMGRPSDITGQTAQRLAEEMHAEIAALRGALDAANQRLDELAAQLEDLPHAPDLTGRIQQIEDRLQ